MTLRNKKPYKLRAMNFLGFVRSGPYRASPGQMSPPLLWYRICDGFIMHMRKRGANFFYLAAVYLTVVVSPVKADFVEWLFGISGGVAGLPVVQSAVRQLLDTKTPSDVPNDNNVHVDLSSSPPPEIIRVVAAPHISNSDYGRQAGFALQKLLDQTVIPTLFLFPSPYCHYK